MTITSTRIARNRALPPTGAPVTTTPCYRCGLQPAMLPIAYCAECYKATGARLLTSSEVALTLGIDRSRVNLLALRHGIGLASGPRGTRLYTPAMVETLRAIRRPGGRPVTTNRYTLLRSTPDGETYAAGIAPDGTLTHITADLASDDVEDILEGRANIADFEYDEPSEGQVEAWERDGWETGPRLVEFETRTTVYETHPDGSPALWMETVACEPKECDSDCSVCWPEGE